jgi:L-lactate dehydrogenase
VVFAGAQQGDLIATTHREAGVERNRLVGSAPEAFSAAVRAIVAAEARCSSGEVMLTVLGIPPAGFVIPWSEASIGGYALHHSLEQVQLLRVEARAARLWPPGPYALGAAAARVTEAMLDSSRAAFPVMTILDGEFGVRDRVGTMPVLLSERGIVHRRTPSLNPRERVQLETALSL